MIDQFKPGSDLTIMNTYFQYAKRDDNGEKISNDLIVVVYKDNTTGRKYHEIIENPQITFYVANDDVKLTYNHLFIEKDKVHPVSTPYSKLKKKIAEVTGNMDFYNQCVREGNRKPLNALMEDKRIFSSDMSVEDYYRSVFARKFQNNICKVSKAYFDIEVDGRWAAGEFAELGECPVNAISFLDESHKVSIQYLLRNSENPLIAQYENKLRSGEIVENDIKEFVKEAVGGYKQFKRYHLDEYSFQIMFFDNELDMMERFFNQVHIYDPDFILSYNGSAFDISYIIERIKVLGEAPEHIMADPSWEIGIVNNWVDEKNLSELAERNDYTFISGNTVWIDQMIEYASRRKAKIGSYKSFKLDDIGELVAGVHKLDYSHITTEITMLPWLDYKTFSLYNIMDTIVQHCIEQKCQDIEYIFQKAIMNGTGYSKVHRQTVYLINRMRKEWYDKHDYIMGNNINKHNSKIGKFEGALVMDPLKLGDDNKMLMFECIPINIIENCIDFDFRALYPSGIDEGNIASNTQVGRLDIPNKWKAVYHYDNNGIKKDIPVWIFDPGNGHDFPFIMVEVKDGKKKRKEKIWAKIYLYLDEKFTKPIDLTGNGTNEIEYHPELFTTEIYERVYDNENSYMNNLYTRGGEFMENKVCDNIIEFCHRWFGLADFQEILSDIDEYYHKTYVSYSSHGYWQEFNKHEEKLIITPLYDTTDRVVKPLYFENDRIHPVSFYSERVNK